MPQNITVDKNISEVAPPKFSAEHTSDILITLRRTSVCSYKDIKSMGDEIEVLI